MSRDLLSLNLFGIPALSSTTGPVAISPGAALVAAYLALGPAEGRSREAAATQLFADSPVGLGRRRLSTAVWRLRTEVRAVTGYDLIATSTERLAISPGVRVTTDAVEFEDLVRPVLAARAEALDDDAVARLERAVSLHRGLLVEPCRDEWVLAERTRLENLYLTALDYLLIHYGARGEIGAVGKYGELALAIEPLREDLHRHLLAAYGAAGRDDLVERQFERCRRLLVDELGVDPMPETVALYARLRQGRGVGTHPTVQALVADLEGARRDLGRLTLVIDRALDHLAHLT
ncbi:MAG TPA: bacterial transcriptional activator domain-containing protein [Ornithinibacter sp.]|nr:bacterial transcriptional activator domain-containing protein [Ornithinibacter sp.]